MTLIVVGGASGRPFEITAHTRPKHKQLHVPTNDGRPHVPISPPTSPPPLIDLLKSFIYTVNSNGSHRSLAGDCTLLFPCLASSRFVRLASPFPFPFLLSRSPFPHLPRLACFLLGFLPSPRSPLLPHAPHASLLLLHPHFPSFPSTANKQRKNPFVWAGQGGGRGGALNLANPPSFAARGGGGSTSHSRNWTGKSSSFLLRRIQLRNRHELKAREATRDTTISRCPRRRFLDSAKKSFRFIEQRDAYLSLLGNAILLLVSTWQCKLFVGFLPQSPSQKQECSREREKYIFYSFLFFFSHILLSLLFPPLSLPLYHPISLLSPLPLPLLYHPLPPPSPFLTPPSPFITPPPPLPLSPLPPPSPLITPSLLPLPLSPPSPSPFITPPSSLSLYHPPPPSPLSSHHHPSLVPPTV
ncbi:hypothetical protein C7M84_021468 [Penaeus vannamei]|uniref:Uncharacterized protein n=1 Tax=Penaeus vannamei TaxID=6689 RepID=A0A423S9H2_PENVA|nr:hypothetical protein C7M84_021468 [Penaeus vannamei]